MILLLDNYDSFTYNVYQLISELGGSVEVVRNDKITIEAVKSYSAVIISPGPGIPSDAGISEQIISELKGELPILGICLGHQLLALANGFQTGKLKYGHRGGNQPCKDLESGKTYITSQNHGYQVLSESIDPEIAKESFVNVNDGTCEGITYLKHPAITAQFHPEARGGPTDTNFLFDNFMKLMEVKSCH